MSATAARPRDPPASRAEGHRQRLIAAMACSIEQRGFRDTSVADVVRIARTSRRSFYEHFEDRAACFLALFETTTEEMMSGIASAVAPQAPWQAQVEAALRSYLDSVEARPQLFRAFTRELPALGQVGAERQRAVVERFADTLLALAQSGTREQGGRVLDPLGRDAAILIVGGLRELTVSALEQRRDMRELRASAAPLVEAIIAAALLKPDELARRAGDERAA